MKRIIATLGVLASLAATAAAHATGCGVQFTDCYNVQWTVTWSCQDCWPYGAPKLGVCSYKPIWNDPENPTCMITISPFCIACTYPISAE